MDNRLLKIDKLDISTKTKVGTQVSGSAVVLGNVETDQSKHIYKAETLILNKKKGQIDSINFNFDLESLQGTTANRNAELEQMRAVLAEPTTGSGAKFVVLVGMGGAGKTTLAKMYFKAENDREPFDHQIWIDAEEPENVTASFKQLLADYLDVHRQFAGEQQLINAVYNSILKQKTIIVFDNVEQVERIRQFFPKLVSSKNPPPHVIVTTRNSGGWQDYKDHLVHVGELSLETCEDYIRDSLVPLKITDIEDKWAELAEHFGRLVMALRTATLSIVEQNQLQDANDREPYKLEDFLNEVQKPIALGEENKDLFDPVEATYRHLKQLWNATLDRLSKQTYGQLGERILEVLAFLSPTGVPVEWISIVCAEFIESDRMLMNATHFMISRSLVAKSEKKYIVHRVFQTTLLSRISAKPEKLTATLDWLLPRIEQLHLKLALESKLQDFYPHLHTLAKNIELRGNVPDSVVSFLVNMQLEGGYMCTNLREELVEKLLKKDISVSCKSLELVLAQGCVRESVLLLPDWIRDCSDEMSIEEQLRQIRKSLTPFSWRLPFQRIESVIVLCQAVVQVLEKWKPKSNAHSEDYLSAQPELDVLNIVERLFEGLDEWMYNRAEVDEGIDGPTLNAIHTMLQRLKKVLDAALPVGFHQPKVDNLETKLKYIDVVYKLFHLLVSLQSCFTDPESAFNISFTGVDHVMIDWYQVQLERLYRNYREECPTQKNSEFGSKKLKAIFIAALVNLLVTSLSDTEQEQYNVADVNEHLMGNEAKILDQVIQFLNFSNDRTGMLTEDLTLRSFIGVFIVYLALEPHLNLLERILVRLEQATDVHQKQQIIVAIEPFVESIRRNISKYEDQKSLLDLFSGHFDYCDDPVETKKHILPNLENLAEVTDKIMAHYDDQLSLALHGCDPERLVEKLEDANIRHRCTDESTQLRTALEQALKTAQAVEGSSVKRNCECIVARIQRMLARLDLKDGKTEAAIQLASEAFNHQLYCTWGGYMDETIKVLFDAFGKCGDSEAQKLELVRKLFNGHMDVYGQDDWITKTSQIELIRLLCSTGSILEAADLAEKYIDSSFKPHGDPEINLVLTVPLLLLLSGENERVVSLSECMLRNATATNLEPDEKGRSDKIRHFAILLGKVDASCLALFKDDETKEFQKYASILIQDPYSYECQPPRIYEEWIDNRVKFLHVNDKMTNEEETDTENRIIDTTKRLDDDTLKILWFDTMERVLRRDPKNISASLFAPLEHQLELRNAGTQFKLYEDELEWSVKCFVGMFQKQQLWFQKTGVPTDGAEADTD